MKRITTYLLATCILLSMGGCSTTNDPSSASESMPMGSEEPAKDNTSSDVNDDATSSVKPSVLNCAWNDEPTSLDLIKYSGANDLKLIWNLYEPLVRIENGQIIGAGAESWTVSDDGLTYTFELRDNEWSDGIKVKAEDYAYELKRQADPDNMFSYASDYFNIKNFEAVYNGELDKDKLGVRAKDDTTLVIELEYPNTTFLSSVELYPDRSDIVEKYGNDHGFSPDTMVYSGPFKLTSWEHNSSVVLEKNENYWDAGNVKLDSVNLHIINDESTRLTNFQSGAIDYVSCSDSDHLELFRNSDEMYEEHAQSARTYMFLFNCKNELMKNSKIRQALSLSINRDEICSILDSSLTTPAYGLIPPATVVGTLDYRKNVDEPLIELGGSVEDVKALFTDGLKELGISDSIEDITITLSCPSDSLSQENAEYYKNMWEKALGITVEINMQEFSTYKSLIWSDEYQVATTAWGGSIEPRFMLTRWLPDNQSQWDNDEYSKLVEEGERSSDESVRLKKYAEAEKLLVADNAAIAPIKYDGYSIFYYNYVHGAVNDPFSNVGFKTMYIE